MPSVLIVEDDPTLLRGVSDNFSMKGYHVSTATDGEAGLDMARRLRPDLIVLDVMMPLINGYEVCRCLRQEQIAIPIIFLTAKVEESDVLLGLGLGADDYLRKPFSIRELMARAEVLLRRNGPASADQATEYAFDQFRLDRSAHKLRTASGESVKLSPKEYALLSYLVEHAGRALSRTQIMDAVWGYDAGVTPRSIDRFVTTLRKKIAPKSSGQRTRIETIREFGYRFRESK